MVRLVEFPLEDGGTVLVEVAAADEGPTRAGVGDVIKKASETFEKSLAVLEPVGRALVQRLRGLSPQEVSIEFGVKLSGEKGLIIARGAAEASFTVKLTWKDAAKEAKDG